MDAPLCHEAGRGRHIGLHPGGWDIETENGRRLPHRRPSLPVPHVPHPIRQRCVQSSRCLGRGGARGRARVPGPCHAPPPLLEQGALPPHEPSSTTGDNNRGEEVRDEGPSRDAVPPSPDTEGGGRGPLLRPR